MTLRGRDGLMLDVVFTVTSSGNVYVAECEYIKSVYFDKNAAVPTMTNRTPAITVMMKDGTSFLVIEPKYVEEWKQIILSTLESQSYGDDVIAPVAEAFGFSEEPQTLGTSRVLEPEAVNE